MAPSPARAVDGDRKPPTVSESPERRLLEFFFRYPTSEFHFREMARELDLAIGTVSKYVELLEGKELVSVRTAGNMKLVEPRFDSKEFRRLKRVSNLSKVYGCGLVDLLGRKLAPEALVLFGSYSRGEDHEGSDVDIASIGGKEGELDLSSFEEEVSRDVEVQYVEAERAEREFLTTLANGIVLAGYLETL